MANRSNSIAETYGTASIHPDGPVVAGTYASWTITYSVGDLGMDDGGRLKIAANMTSDWGHPQFDDPDRDNYATVATSGPAGVTGTFDVEGHVRPFKHAIKIEVFDGSLAPGDTVSLTLGETDGPSLGHQVQTYPETDFELGVLVDPFGTGEFVRLPDSLTFDIVPGHPRRLEAVVPSCAAVDRTVDLRVRAMDYWGNVATRYNGTASIDYAAADGLEGPDSVAIQAGRGSAPVEVEESGVHRLTLTDDEIGADATTNPVRCESDLSESVFWGDIHGQSGETVGTGTIQEYFEYLRDKAHLDFGSHAGNDFQITDEFWEEIKETVRAFNSPGEFVTFLCYEWSANTSRGGDHNVYFRDPSTDPEIYRSSSWQIADGFDKHVGTFPVSELYDQYRGREDVLIIPHRGGRPAPLDVFDPELTPLVEILSVWGVFEWYGQEALSRGYEVGFIAGSDDHTGRPGASYPTNETDWAFPVKGGLLAAKATELTREALWAAFKNRRCYATTGARIDLDVDAAGAGMGEAVETTSPVGVDVAVRGTAPIERIDLVGVDETIDSRNFNDGADRLEVAWTGARSKTRHKVQDWSGGLNISDGRIEAVAAVGFDHPDQGVDYRSDTELRWTAMTAGNRQSLRLMLTAPDSARLTIGTPPANAEFRLSELAERKVVDAGPVDRRLSVRRIGRATERDVDVTFSGIDIGGSPTPLYVRVRQADGEMAWSSPVFVYPADT